MTEAEIIYQPTSQHRCGPGGSGHWIEFVDGKLCDYWRDRPGTVRECHGKTWVAVRDERDPGFMGVKWRREGWWERRKRLKGPSQ